MTTNLIIFVLMQFVLIIFTVLLFHKGLKKYSNRMLAYYFISQIVGIGGSIMLIIFHQGRFIYLLFYPVLFTWGPLYYNYICSLLNNSFRLKWMHLLHYIPAFIVCIIIITFLCMKYIYGTEQINQGKYLNRLYIIFNQLFNLQIVAYNIIAFSKFIVLKKKFKDEYSSLDRTCLNWLKISIFGFFVACMITQVTRYFNSNNLFTSVNWIFISNATFILFFTLLFYLAIIHSEILLHTSAKEKYKNSFISACDAKKMIEYLDNYMITHKPFKRSNLSLKELADCTGIQERLLSRLINEYKKQNFFDYINYYRVKTVMEILNYSGNHTRKMFDILFDSGFNSKTTFNAAFKKYTGITPSDYRKKQNVQVMENLYA